MWERNLILHVNIASHTGPPNYDNTDINGECKLRTAIRTGYSDRLFDNAIHTGYSAAIQPRDDAVFLVFAWLFDRLFGHAIANLKGENYQ